MVSFDWMVFLVCCVLLLMVCVVVVCSSCVLSLFAFRVVGFYCCCGCGCGRGWLLSFLLLLVFLLLSLLSVGRLDLVVCWRCQFVGGVVVVGVRCCVVVACSSFMLVSVFVIVVRCKPSLL